MHAVVSATKRCSEGVVGRHRARWILPLAVLVAATFVAVPASAQTTLMVGDPFPDFTAYDHTGSSPGALFQLSSHHGKVVLLHFCALWCLPCRFSATQEANLIAALDEQIGAENWLLVDVLVEDQDQEATDHAEANLWRNAFDTPALTLHSDGARTLEDLGNALGLEGVPTYLVVAPDGTLGAVVVEFDGSNQPLIDAVAEVWAAHADVVPPAIAGKRDVVVETKVAPVQVKFTYPAAVDAVDGPVPVSCLPQSGSLFRFGTWPIECTASDASGNTSHSSFKVIVRLPTTVGAVTPPGNPGKPLSHVGPGQRVRVTAGGFAAGTAASLSFTTATGGSIPLGGATAAIDGQIDVLVKVPAPIAGGAGQVTATGLDLDGAEFIRAWLLTIEGPPAR
jgi:hypothetical protein